MQEADYYNSKENNVVQCVLCPRNCFIQPDKTGFCRVRKNIDGKLYSLVYGKTAGGLSVDPIEKKPLFHFLPSTSILSFGTVGCNLHCKHCQNWNTSQVEAGQAFEKKFSPEKIVEVAKQRGCRSIAYTYNEPTIFYEYMLDTANIARKEELKNVMVSNGFINEKPLKELCKYLDGINIDLKGFTNFFYGKTTTAWIQPVLDSLKILRKEDVLLEITNLIIPSLNDDLKEVEKMCSWIKKNLGIDVPLHFSAFHPDFELRNLPSTPLSTLMNAYDIAKTTGLRYVYIGNVITKNYENTYCPDCKTLIIERMGFNVLQNHILRGKCEFCDCKIEGVFH